MSELKKYIKEKIRMLTKEFHFNLTNEELHHFYELKTEVAVDNYAHDIFVRKL